MARVIAKKRSVNQEIVLIVKKYTKSASKRELLFDSIFPLLISCICVTLAFLFAKSHFLELVKDLNTNSLTVLSILAGFNTASLAVISSSNVSKFVDEIDDEKVNGRELLEKFLCFFVYAIILQLT
jgi:hypothetical protein